MLSFQNPVAFLLLLLIPVLIILRKLKIFTSITFPMVLSDWNGKAFKWNGKPRKLMSLFAKAILFAGFICVVAAFADPVISWQEKVYTSLGTDIVFVVDTSPSMAAKDVDGTTRLEAAKNTIKTVAQEHDGYRFGIVALGSNSAVYVPPTGDFATFSKKLGEIKVGILGNGSAIGDGLSTAVCHLVSSSAPKKCIILLTDGENNAGEIHPETAAKLASEKNIALYVVGIGSKGSVPIEYTDPVSGKLYSGYLDSNFNSASLRKIASVGNGGYFEVRSTSELLETFNSVAKKESVTQSFTYRNVNELIYDKFLFIGFLLLGFAWVIKRVLLNELV
ncbi:MAG: VWA domain-containing protein [Treponema sp.]|nr:VWA domain-containing protein [Treponema sp.]